MVTQSAVMVIGHRPHELFALGQVIKLQPDIFIISRSPHCNADEEATLVKKNLSEVGFDGEVTVSNSLERDLYGAMLGGQMKPFRDLFEELANWIEQRQPGVVLTDAYERYNPIHDLCPVMASAAINKLPHVREHVNRILEIPLGHVALNPDAWDEHNWISRRTERVVLDEETLKVKRRVMRRLLQPSSGTDAEAVSDDPSVLISQWTDQQFATEFVGKCDLDRDFTQSPLIVNWTTYDEHGKQRVLEGKYSEAISFQSHFLPIIEMLGRNNPLVKQSLPT